MMASRNKQLALIHIARGQLAMADDAYRDMLFRIARVRSAADLDSTGRDAVLDHLRYLGFRPHSPPRDADRDPQLQKIGALLADMRLSWNYARGIAKQMFGVDALEFCGTRELKAIITALVNHREKRREKSAS